MHMFKSLIILVFSLCSALTFAVTHHDLATLELGARQFAEQEWQGEARLNFGKLSTNLRVATCPQVKYSWANHQRKLGATSVMMTCAKPFWTLRLPVTVTAQKQVVTTTRALKSGTTLSAGDLVLKASPTGVAQDRFLFSLNDAVGKVLTRSILADTALRTDMLERVQLVRSGQPVRVVARSDSFEVSSEGVAASHGAAGDTVRVRVNGKMISGRVRADGVVEILM